MEQMKIQPEDWKEDYKEFDEATEKFYKGEVDAKTYKGISGGFGSYAQRGGNASMLRLRMSGGVMDLAKLKFIADAIETYHIKRVHLTTCTVNIKSTVFSCSKAQITEGCVGQVSRRIRKTYF